MSDDLMQDEIDRRPHRCRPPRARRKGATWDCDCGIVFQFVGTQFGWQWLPRETSAEPVVAISHRPRSAMRGVVPPTR